jgi:branched-subunit amino acid aminotransferase/4-amino-4-deoxychorismate lyase
MADRPRPGPQDKTLVWAGPDGGWTTAEPMDGPPDVADSWLVADGLVRGFHRHWSRFAASCRDLGVNPSRLDDLRGDLISALPRADRWFPRIELHSGFFLLHLRPAPERQPTVSAWVCDRPDPRRHPRRKGPDLHLLAELREDAARHGAGEAVLIDDDGRLLEGAYTSLLWWEGPELYAVPDEAPILQGVTRRLLLQLALVEGVPIRYARPTPAELADREVWLTSALHGIRTATSWGAAPRAEHWQQRLEALARTP